MQQASDIQQTRALVYAIKVIISTLVTLVNNNQRATTMLS